MVVFPLLVMIFFTSLMDDGLPTEMPMGIVDADNTTTTRTRNPYSDYGYYFITQTDGARKECSEAELLSSAAANGAAYHALYESDGFAWHEMGRELVEAETIAAGTSKTVNLSIPDSPGTVTVTAVLTATSAGYTVSVGRQARAAILRQVPVSM